MHRLGRLARCCPSEAACRRSISLPRTGQSIRTRNFATIEPLSKQAESDNTKTVTEWRQSQTTSAGILSLVEAGSEQHHDMATFKRYVEDRKLNKRSTVYVGVHYEYTVSDTLSRYGFDIKRVGRASDKGIDLIGYWHLPHGRPMQVIGQCKAAKATPSMIRELEGAVIGAPAAWRGEDVLFLLATSTEATKGVRDAVSRSRVPMGFVNITSQKGVVRQFLWNQAAGQIGLEAINAVVRYGGGDAGEDMRQELCLTWQDKPWKPS